MTYQVNKNEILDSYLVHIDEISFIKEDERETVSKYIETLKDDKKSIEEHLNVGADLWKLFFKKALFSLTGDLQDSKKIFEYFKEYVDFETLLFGVDDFYRDHTLHSLWVYFVGEYLLKNGYVEPKNIQISIDFFKDCKEGDIKISNEVRTKVIDKINEIWCLTSLTHDLAYPISSIEKLNKKISSILPYFGKFIKQDFSLEKSFIQKEIIDKMLRIICSDIMFAEGKEAKQILKHDLYLSLYDSIENSEHGVLSSYLIFRNLLSMIRTPFYETGSNVSHDEEEIIIFLSNQAILKSIALHTCKFKRFSRYPSFESLLVLSDEIEEFSRWTRAKNKRSYIDELCKVSIDINEENIVLEYIFDNSELKSNPEDFFKNKCKTFINLFNIKLINCLKPPESKKPPNIKIIVYNKMEVPHKDYLFEIKDGEPSHIETKILRKVPEVVKILKKDEIENYIGLI